ncbi:MAG: ABC transporter ATP-binding protein [Lachnospiraceae bacterium]|nr:ABC transporter ATP-binding protein [Lachnospiraceae bacterium]
MSLITVTDLTLGYGSRAVAEGVSFTVEEGDYLCIIGENGSGKTTLMKTLLGLQAPLSGAIRKEGLLPGEIGYLPQQTDVQKDFPASVREIVLSGFQGRAGLRPFYTRAEKERAAEVMERLGVSALARRSFRELSGGQKQRVLLARALCATEKILLLDEPVSGLDPDAAETMYRTIRELNDAGTAVIMISHDIAAAEQYASRILRMGAQVTFEDRKEAAHA